MLHTKNKNHHITRLGAITIIPLVRYDLRVWVILYEMLAKMNSADEHRPCAIIIIRAPVIPQVDMVITPAISRPMWPTDE